MVEVMVVIDVMIVMGVVLSAVMSVGIDATARTDKGRSPRPHKGPATMRAAISKATARSNGKAPGATAKRVATKTVTAKAATAKRMSAEPAPTKGVTTKTATAKPATSVACLSQWDCACHRH